MPVVAVVVPEAGAELSPEAVQAAARALEELARELLGHRAESPAALLDAGYAETGFPEVLFGAPGTNKHRQNFELLRAGLIEIGYPADRVRMLLCAFLWARAQEGGRRPPIDARDPPDLR